jgi:TolA-binding protein
MLSCSFFLSFLIPDQSCTTLQVDEGSLARLQEAASSKAARLQGQQQQLEQLQQRLGGLQEELQQLNGQLAAKKEEAKAAQAEHRKARCVRQPTQHAVFCACCGAWLCGICEWS